jgi:hypothetical protein
MEIFSMQSDKSIWSQFFSGHFCPGHFFPGHFFSDNGPVSMLFFITKKEFISENNNIVEEKFSFSLSFPHENVIFLTKSSSAIERNHFL